MRRIRLWTAAILLAVASMLIGCVGIGAPTAEQQFWSARAAFNETHAGYNRFLAFDNAQVQNCYAAHPGLKAAAAAKACPPALDENARQRGMDITAHAQNAIGEVDEAIHGGTVDAKTISEAVGRLESFGLQLVVLYSAGGAR